MNINDDRDDDDRDEYQEAKGDVHVLWLDRVFIRDEGELTEADSVLHTDSRTHAIRRGADKAKVYDAGFLAGWTLAMEKRESNGDLAAGATSTPQTASGFRPLDEHVEASTQGPRVYRCRHCGRRFKRRLMAARHAIRKHGAVFP